MFLLTCREYTFSDYIVDMYIKRKIWYKFNFECQNITYYQQIIHYV